MKTFLVTMIFIIIAPVFLIASGQKEAGRDTVKNMVSEGQFVAKSFVDVEAYLDDYRLEYTPDKDAALSVFVEVDKPVTFYWGDTITLQVVVATSNKDFFPIVPFSYVLFFNDPDIFKNRDMSSKIAMALKKLIIQKKPGERIFVFLQKDNLLEEIAWDADINDLLHRAEIQAQRTNPEVVLEHMLVAGESINSSAPTKYLWVLGKPFADSKADIRDISYLIAAYGSTATEISFCGYNGSFRAETVNRIVNQYGGNSYYISDNKDISSIISDDYTFYQRPAVSNLLVSVHTCGISPQQSPIRIYTQNSMGSDEYHTFLVRMKVPSQIEYQNMLKKSKDEKEKQETPENYPLTIVTYQYYNHTNGKMEYGSKAVSVKYGSDYAEYRLSANPRVEKSKAIINTARLLRIIASQVRSRQFERAIISIRNHVKMLENVNRFFNDPLIAEDIATLKQYKILIAEQKRNPGKGVKIYYELGRRKY